MENLISITEKENLSIFRVEKPDQILIGMLTNSVDTDEMLLKEHLLIVNLWCDYGLGYLFIELLGSPHYSLQR